MLPFAPIFAAIKLAGAATPAFKALFEQVLPTFSSTDQMKLKRAYEEARKRSDEAQDDFVKASRGG